MFEFSFSVTVDASCIYVSSFLKLTYVDLGIFNLFDFLSTMFKKDANELLGAHPKLLALCKRVKELPKVAAYLESRPPM